MACTVGGRLGQKKGKQLSTFSSDIVDWCTYLEDKIGHKVVNRFSKLPFQSLSVSFSDSEGGQPTGTEQSRQIS